MAEAALLDFQLQEWADAIRYTLVGLAFVTGTGLWGYATFFMKDGRGD